MAFQEHTTVNSHKHVIDLLEAFLTAQGWTIDASTNTAERELYVSKANGGETFYFSIKSFGTSQLTLFGNTAYPEAGSSTVVYMSLKSTSMVRCWLFSGELYAYIVVEVAAGYFQWLGFGRLTPYGSFAAANKEGAFTLGHNSSSTVWSAANTTISVPLSCRVRHVPTAGVQWSTATFGSAYSGGGASFNQTSESLTLQLLRGYYGMRPMLPLRVNAPHNPAIGSGFAESYPLGYLPGLRVLSFLDVIAASEQTLGSDTWKRFPVPLQNIAVTPLTLYPGTELGGAFLK